MTVPWVTDYNANVSPNNVGTWQRSTDSGATYVAAPAGPVTPPNGPTGTERYRNVITLTATQRWTMTLSGDIVGNLGGNAQVYYDGVYQGDALQGPAQNRFTFPPGSGSHTIEIWTSASNGVGDLTAPIITFNANVPCDCCPAGGVERCGVVQGAFTTVTQTVAETGWNGSTASLQGTIDGSIAGTPLYGYTTSGATIPSTALRVEYGMSAMNRVVGLRLWNQAGSDLNDADGLGSFNADFYAGATLLATMAFVGANGGAPISQRFPGGQELNGVTRVVLRNLGTLGNVNGVKPLWRELVPLRVERAYPCRRQNGTLEWYGVSGALIPQTDLVACS